MAVGLLFMFYPRFHRAAEPYTDAAQRDAAPCAGATVPALVRPRRRLQDRRWRAALRSLSCCRRRWPAFAGSAAIISCCRRRLGATPGQLFFKVTLPSAVPVIFSGLRLGLIFALLGVVGAEMIAAEHGLGQTLAYLQSTFSMDGVMAHPAVARPARALRDPSHEPPGARSTLLAVNGSRDDDQPHQHQV